MVKELKASGQMMNSLIIQGVSKVFGGFLGGILASVIAIKYVFLINSVICIAAVLGFFAVARGFSLLNGQNRFAADVKQQTSAKES